MTHAFLEDEIAVQDDILVRISRLSHEKLHLENMVEAAEEHVKTLKEKLRRLSTEDLPALFHEAGVREVTLGDGTEVKIESLVSVSIPKGNEDACLTHLEQNGLEWLIKNTISADLDKGDNQKADAIVSALEAAGVDFNRKMSVHPQSLKKQARDLYQDGVVFPDIFKPFYGFEAKIKKPKVV